MLNDKTGVFVIKIKKFSKEIYLVQTIARRKDLLAFMIFK
jgi:hypothetical protein